MSWSSLVSSVLTALLIFIGGRLSRRLDRRQEVRTAAAAQTPRFTLNPESGILYRLTNEGDITAEEVGVDPHGYQLTRDLPDGITMRPNEPHIVTILRVDNVPDPTHFYVSWKGCGEPQVLPVPRPRD